MTAAVLTLINGRESNHVNIADRGLSFGDGVFETLLLKAGQLSFYPRHRARLARGLSCLQIPCESDIIDQQVQQFLALAAQRGLADGIVKIVITRGQGRGYAPADTLNPTVITSLYSATDLGHYQRDGVTITVCRQRVAYQPALLGIKHLNRLDNVLAAIEARQGHYIEGIMLDDVGNIAEAISRNVFVVSQQCLQTPDLKRGGIHGIMRGLIIDELALQLGIAVVEQAMSPKVLETAEEVFLCNSISGIWPVVGIDDHEYAIGVITKRLQQSVQELIEG